MSSELVLQFGINGLIAGAMYALVATGFSLIYATNRFMHFAHGGVVVVGGYLFSVLLSSAGLPAGIAGVGAIALTGMLGGALYYGVYRPLETRGSSTAVLLIASIALMIILQNIIQLVFGPSVHALQVTSGAAMSVGAVVITHSQILLLGSTLALLGLVMYFTKKTRLGSAMRAVADNQELAGITGINTTKIRALSFIIGSSIAGLAGILIGIEQNLTPTMGFTMMIKGFTGAIVGGVTSVPGAVLGSMTVGLAENMGILWLPSGYKDAIAFVLLFVFLLVRPTGMLGINKGIKK